MEVVQLKPKTEKDAEHKESVFKEFMDRTQELISMPDVETAVILTINKEGGVEFLLGGSPDPRNLVFMVETARDIVRENF